MVRAPRVLATLAPLLALGLLISPAAAQSPTVSPATDPSGPDPVLAAALDGLAALDRSRVEVWTRSPITGDAEVGAVTEVIRGDDPRLRFQIVDGGEVALDEIVVGDTGWRQLLGTAYRPMTEVGDYVPTVDDPPGGPQILERLLEAGITLTKVGEEAANGRATLHYHGELAAPTATAAPGDYYAQSISGTLDLWVDAADGYLVRSVADTQPRDGYAQMLHQPTIPWRERTEVTAVDDATLAIAPPDLAPAPQPSPAGDPALADTVLGAFTALDALTSYRATVADQTLGFGGGMDLVVLPGSETRVQGRLRAGSLPYMELLAVGDQVWRRDTAEAPWAPADPAELTCFDGPCDADQLVRFERGIDGLLDTFTLVSETETLDGTPAIHLQSTAGWQTQQAGLAPGVTDLWLAKDGGHLLAITFDGQGTRSSIKITGIDDPANTVETPQEVIPLDASPSPAS